MVEKSVRDLTREKTGMERTEAQLIADIKKAAKANQVKSCKIMAKGMPLLCRRASLRSTSPRCPLSPMQPDLVRTRKHKEKFTNLCAQLRVMSLQMSEVASQQALAESMKNVTKAMTALNKQVNLPQLQATMAEFQKQSEIMEMKQEMMEDAMDGALLLLVHCRRACINWLFAPADVMDDDETEEDIERVVQSVFDEIGITLNEQLIGAPMAEAKKVRASFIPMLTWHSSHCPHNDKVPHAQAAIAAPVAEAKDVEAEALEARLANLKR